MERFGTAWLAGVALAALVASSAAIAQSQNVGSEKVIGGVKFPESVGCDQSAQVLYVSQFGSELKPAQKDGEGFISKLSPEGEVLDERFLPAEGQTLDKPKGIWIEDGNLWVTDIDKVWKFDLQTKEGKSVALPGAQFANDPTIVGDALYVSDNRGDQLFRVEPADFLGMAEDPAVSVVFSGASVNPNGVYPGNDGSLLMVGMSAEEPRAIYSMPIGGEPQALSEAIGRLDGIHEMANGTLLVTDWVTGSLFSWSAESGMRTLASGFKGPADFCVLETSDGSIAVVPDLVASELRIVPIAME
jgi:hypothetical protein